MRGVFTYNKQDIEKLVREDLEARTGNDHYFGDVPVQINVESNELVSVVVDVSNMDDLPLLDVDDEDVFEDEEDEEGVEDEDTCHGCSGSVQ